MFRQWWGAFDDGVEVSSIQAPGREERFREDPLLRMDEWAEAAAHQILPLIDGEYAVYGHSVGALVGFETLRRLRALAVPPARHFFVAASRAPHLPPTRPPIAHLPDLDLLEQVQDRYGSIPIQVMQDADLRSLVLRPLRADLAALEAYSPCPDPPIDCSITAIGAYNDRMVSQASLREWRQYTRGGFDCHMVRGEHIFLESQRVRLLEIISSALGVSFPNGG